MKPYTVCCILTVVVCALIFVACSKESNPVDSTDNSPTGLLSRTWEVDFYKVNGLTTGIHKGTLQVFSKDGSFTWKRSDESELSSGQWEFQENETKIKLPFATVTIDTLTSGVLRYSTQISGGTATFRLIAK